jgi:HSP20 family protein
LASGLHFHLGRNLSKNASSVFGALTAERGRRRMRKHLRSKRGRIFIMVLRRRNGFGPLLQLRDEMDRLVGDFFGPVTASVVPRVAPQPRSFPALNVWETPEAVFAEAEVPGLKAEDLDVSVVGTDLTIRGKRGEALREGAAFHRQERGAGEFNRVLRLPIEVNADRVEASLKDGVLLIKMPKAESAKPKKIKVSTPSSNQS